MKEKIFFSYSHADRGLAKQVEKQLQGLLKSKSQSFTVIDERKIVSPGKDIRKSLKAAMDSASTVVFLAAPGSEKSQRMNYEAGLADALGKRMVVLGKKELAKAGPLGNLPNDVQWIDLDTEG